MVLCNQPKRLFDFKKKKKLNCQRFKIESQTKSTIIDQNQLPGAKNRFPEDLNRLLARGPE